MAGPPFPAAILTDLTVFRIGDNLLAAIIGAPPPLAFWPTANGLTGLELRGLEDLITIATTPFDHTGVVSWNPIGGRVLETFVSWYRILADGHFLSTTNPAKLRLFYSGADTDKDSRQGLRLPPPAGRSR
jgi:hypothetical protein